MSKQDVINKIKEILARDESFKDVKIEITFKDKRSPLRNYYNKAILYYNLVYFIIYITKLH